MHVTREPLYRHVGDSFLKNAIVTTNGGFGKGIVLICIDILGYSEI